MDDMKVRTNEVVSEPKPIAQESAAIQRARRKALRGAAVAPTAEKTEQAARAVRERHAHNPHELVNQDVRFNEDDADIKALRERLQNELASPEQARIQSIARVRFGG